MSIPSTLVMSRDWGFSALLNSTPCFKYFANVSSLFFASLSVPPAGNLLFLSSFSLITMMNKEKSKEDRARKDVRCLMCSFLVTMEWELGINYMFFCFFFVQMWMNARPSPASAKEATASTQWGPLNVNAPLGTNSMRSRRNAKVSFKLWVVVVRRIMWTDWLSESAWMTEYAKKYLKEPKH